MPSLENLFSNFNSHYLSLSSFARALPLEVDGYYIESYKLIITSSGIVYINGLRCEEQRWEDITRIGPLAQIIYPTLNISTQGIHTKIGISGKFSIKDLMQVDGFHRGIKQIPSDLEGLLNVAGVVYCSVLPSQGQQMEPKTLKLGPNDDMKANLVMVAIATTGYEASDYSYKQPGYINEAVQKKDMFVVPRKRLDEFFEMVKSIKVPEPELVYA
jgi:hypothetical protein